MMGDSMSCEADLRLCNRWRVAQLSTEIPVHRHGSSPLLLLWFDHRSTGSSIRQSNGMEPWREIGLLLARHKYPLHHLVSKSQRKNNVTYQPLQVLLPVARDWGVLVVSSRFPRSLHASSFDCPCSACDLSFQIHRAYTQRGA